MIEDLITVERYKDGSVYSIKIAATLKHNASPNDFVQMQGMIPHMEQAVKRRVVDIYIKEAIKHFEQSSNKVGYYEKLYGLPLKVFQTQHANQLTLLCHPKDYEAIIRGFSELDLLAQKAEMLDRLLDEFYEGDLSSAKYIAKFGETIKRMEVKFSKNGR